MLRGHESTVLSLHGDHSKLISGGADTNVCIWDSQTGEWVIPMWICGPDLCYKVTTSLIRRWEDFMPLLLLLLLLLLLPL